MKNILVTTDLSDESVAAFAEARSFAEAFRAKVFVLAIIEDPAQAAMVYALDFPVMPDPDIQEQMIEKVTVDLKEVCEKSFHGLNYEYLVHEAKGPVHSEIIKFAAEHDIDLVVIATHGHTGLSRILIGSTAERVVRECPCPVLTVRSKHVPPEEAKS